MQHRTSKRLSFAQPVRIRCASWGEFLHLYTKDISRGGLFLRSQTTVPPGTKLEVFLLLPGNRELSIDATVVHAISPEQGVTEGRPAGMGVRFDKLTTDQESTLKALWEIAASTPDSPLQSSSTRREAARAWERPTGADAVLRHLRQIGSMLAGLTAWEVLGLDNGASADEQQAAFEELVAEYPPGRFRRFDNSEINEAAAHIVNLFKAALQKLQTPSSRTNINTDATSPAPAATANERQQNEQSTRRSGLEFKALFEDLQMSEAQSGSAALVAEKQLSVTSGSRATSSEWKITQSNLSREGFSTTVKDCLDRARGYLDQERLEAAVQDLEQALAIDPDHRQARAFLHLIEARRLKRKGQRKEALLKYQAALALDETIEEAARELREPRRGRL